jgi:hypothetical protein
LELNKNNLKYKINRDHFGRFESLEFISGEFVGLSVLGDDEKPAFPGSHFFTAEDAPELCTKLETFLQMLNDDGGNMETLEIKEFEGPLASFIEWTAQETEEAIYAALARNNVYGYILQNTSSYAIVRCYNEATRAAEDYKYPVTVNEECVAVLGDPVRVYGRFYTEEEIEATESKDTFAEEEKKEEEDAEKEPVEETPTEETPEEEKTSEEKTEEEKFAEEKSTEEEEPSEEKCIEKEEEEETPSVTEDDPVEEKEEDKREEEEERVEDTADTHSAALSDKTEGEELHGFTAAVDGCTAEAVKFSKEELVDALAAALKVVMNDNDGVVPVVTRFVETTPAYDETNPEHVIKKYSK